MDETQKAAEIFNKWAKNYENKFMDVSLYADSFNFFCDNILIQNPNILEAACGPGNITRFLLEKRPDFKLLGIDLAPNMLDLAQKNNPNAEFEAMDARDIFKINKKFNGIMCGFCLPYLSKNDTLEWIKNAANRLENGGLLYISTMEGDYNTSGIEKGSQGDEIFMYYHEFEYLNNALQTHNLNLIHTERKISTTTTGKTVTDLILIAELVY